MSQHKTRRVVHVPPDSDEYEVVLVKKEPPKPEKNNSGNEADVFWPVLGAFLLLILGAITLISEIFHGLG